MNKTMQDAINGQVQFEMASGHLYLAMSAYFAEVNLPGFAHWMRIQYKEETAHAEKMFDFVLERRGKTTVEAIEKPAAHWASPLAAFEAAFAHEQEVTSRINALLSLAYEIKDHATANFLQWFVTEQVEEEANADKVIQLLKLTGNQPSGLFMIDRELGARVLSLPPTGKTPA